jgi:uncharacterized RDD family membrane protein YckC
LLRFSTKKEILMSDNFNTTGTPPPAANPYSAPKTDLSQQRAPDEAELAGRGRRLGGAIIDSIIVSIVTFVPLLAFIGGWAGYMTMSTERPFFFSLILSLIGFVAFILVNGYFLAKDGQTVAKKLLGMKIVCTDGSKADFVRIVTRRLLPQYAIGVVPIAGGLILLVNYLLIFRASKKCVHDDLADTVVIRV